MFNYQSIKVKSIEDEQNSANWLIKFEITRNEGTKYIEEKYTEEDPINFTDEQLVERFINSKQMAYLLRMPENANKTTDEIIEELKTFKKMIDDGIFTEDISRAKPIEEIYGI